jgi:hypothetical protein
MIPLEVFYFIFFSNWKLGLDYYINMPYTIEIIPDVESGGFVAKIVELEGCITFGDTREEALQMLEDAKRG